MNIRTAVIRFHEGDPIVDKAEKILKKGIKSELGKKDELVIYKESFLRRNKHHQYLSEFYRAPNMFKVKPSIKGGELIKKQDTNALMLLGHGSANKIGNLTPEEMSKFLYDQGLSGPIGIVLMACGVSQVDSYALRLKMDLLQRHKIISMVVASKTEVKVTDTDLEGSFFDTAGGRL